MRWLKAFSFFCDDFERAKIKFNRVNAKFCGKVQQRVFYWFYPVHIAVLAGITNLML